MYSLKSRRRRWWYERLLAEAEQRHAKRELTKVKKKIYNPFLGHKNKWGCVYYAVVVVVVLWVRNTHRKRERDRCRAHFSRRKKERSLEWSTVKVLLKQLTSTTWSNGNIIVTRLFGTTMCNGEVYHFWWCCKRAANNNNNSNASFIVKFILKYLKRIAQCYEI